MHTHGGAVGCVVDGWRYYGSVVDGAITVASACTLMVALSVVLSMVLDALALVLDVGALMVVLPMVLYALALVLDAGALTVALSVVLVVSMA